MFYIVYQDESGNATSVFNGHDRVMNMSGDPVFSATVRSKEEFGTKRSRRMRQAGMIPGNIYGHKEEPVHFTLHKDQLKPILTTGHKVVDFSCNGKTEKAIIQSLQWDTFSKDVLHIELLRVDPNERVKVTLPIVLRGIAAGTLSGGMLEQPHHTIEVDCPAIKIPDNIMIKINDLQIGQAIHVSDIQWSEGVVPHYPAHEVLVRVVTPKAVEEVATELLAVEPELIGKKKEDDTAAAKA
jgi:large subunit ribosomal protein L25